MRNLMISAALVAAFSVPAIAADAPPPAPEQIAVQACVAQRDSKLSAAYNEGLQMMVEIAGLRARVAELEAKAKGGK